MRGSEAVPAVLSGALPEVLTLRFGPPANYRLM
jgi:hypothetical protein